MGEMGQDNSFQVEREGNNPSSISAASKARSSGHKLQREGPGRERKRKYEDSKELDKNICGDGELSSLVRCFSEQGRQATTRNGIEMHLVLPWDISGCFSALSPVIPQCLYW